MGHLGQSIPLFIPTGNKVRLFPAIVDIYGTRLCNEDLPLESRKERLLHPKFHFLPAILESLHPVLKFSAGPDEVMVSLMAART